LKATYSDETISEAIPLIETPEFSADDLRKFATEANLINPAFTRDRLLEAARNPKKAMKFLFGRITVIRNKETSEKV